MFATETELDELLQDHPFIEYIDAIVIDLCGRAIGKRLPVGHVAKMLKAGTPVCAAMQLVDVRGNTADPLWLFRRRPRWHGATHCGHLRADPVERRQRRPSAVSNDPRHEWRDLLV